ncbi:MAG TPA: hypothetical protein VHL11_25760 [Phototrophicaceae bacterium]|jgi:hypothetical protein|nr:hypothetical protein [Phototrophicaceae bacterium]
MLTILVIFTLILAGCGDSSSTPTPLPTPEVGATSTPLPTGGPANDPAVLAVEAYLQAKITGDDDLIRPLLCSALEADFETEASSFDDVKASIEGMTCQRDGDTDVVRCEGKIVAEYNGENTDFPLGAYHVAQDDGVWKWCGAAD